MGLAVQDWNHGYCDHVEGNSITDNPYRAGSPSSNDWLRGWKDAEQYGPEERPDWSQIQRS